MQKSEIEFCLKTPIKYESGGQQSEGFKLILKAPSNRNRFSRALLKQQLMIAFQWMESKKPKDAKPSDDKAAKDTVMSDADISEVGEGLAMAIYAAEGVDIRVVLGEFNKLLIEGTCSVEGEKDLTQSLFEKLSPEDVDAMLGQYLANFIMPS